MHMVSPKIKYILETATSFTLLITIYIGFMSLKLMVAFSWSTLAMSPAEDK